ncbi:MAG: cobalamin biosynthesis bifunctional protein CbiET, partial [Porphyromonadaceae bacterium]|nr:cobalamin biosynthesis bifunctional protein CbiET [Porphyromonadaceae bacterium]
MNDEQCPLFSPEVQQLIARHRVFSGGRRHRELVADLLPAGAVWIDIIVPLSAVYQEYRTLDKPVLVFASGDPLFFGFTT